MVCAVGLTVMFISRSDTTGYQWGNPYIFVEGGRFYREWGLNQ